MRKRITLLTACLLAPFAAHAQLTGAIEGWVTDPSSRVVAGAAMRVIETSTNAERRLSTDHQGH